LEVHEDVLHLLAKRSNICRVGCGLCDGQQRAPVDCAEMIPYVKDIREYRDAAGRRCLLDRYADMDN